MCNLALTDNTNYSFATQVSPEMTIEAQLYKYNVQAHLFPCEMKYVRGYTPSAICTIY